MRNFIKSAWAEAFEGCTPLMVFKRIIAFVIAVIVIVAMCGADSLGGFWVGVIFALAVLIWNVLNLSAAFPNDVEKTWEEIEEEIMRDNENK